MLSSLWRPDKAAAASLRSRRSRLLRSRADVLLEPATALTSRLLDGSGFVLSSSGPAPSKAVSFLWEERRWGFRPRTQREDLRQGFISEKLVR